MTDFQTNRPYATCDCHLAGPHTSITHIDASSQKPQTAVGWKYPGMIRLHLHGRGSVSNHTSHTVDDKPIPSSSNWTNTVDRGLEACLNANMSYKHAQSAPYTFSTYMLRFASSRHQPKLLLLPKEYPRLPRLDVRSKPSKPICPAP